MIGIDPLSAYIILLLVALGIGGQIGWVTGEILRRISKIKQRIVIDAILGSLGFLIGILIHSTFIYWSIEERWVNGQLEYKRTTGYGELIFLALAMSVLVVATRYFIEASRRCICKRRETSNA